MLVETDCGFARVDLLIQRRRRRVIFDGSRPAEIERRIRSAGSGKLRSVIYRRTGLENVERVLPELSRVVAMCQAVINRRPLPATTRAMAAIASTGKYCIHEEVWVVVTTRVGVAVGGAVGQNRFIGAVTRGDGPGGSGLIGEETQSP